MCACMCVFQKLTQTNPLPDLRTKLFYFPAMSVCRLHYLAEASTCDLGGTLLMQEGGCSLWVAALKEFAI